MTTELNSHGIATKTDLSILKSELKDEISKQNTQLFISIAVLILIVSLIFMGVLAVLATRPGL